MSSLRYRAITVTSVTLLFLIVLLALRFDSSRTGDVQHPLVCTANSAKRREDEANILVIFSGRWKFLRVYLPYIYRDLRVNGGVLDKVVFMMVKYNNLTYNNLAKFTRVANSHLKSEVFELNFLGYRLHNAPPVTTGFRVANYDMLDGLMKHPYTIDILRVMMILCMFIRILSG